MNTTSPSLKEKKDEVLELEPVPVDPVELLGAGAVTATPSCTLLSCLLGSKDAPAATAESPCFAAVVPLRASAEVSFLARAFLFQIPASRKEAGSVGETAGDGETEHFGESPPVAVGDSGLSAAAPRGAGLTAAEITCAVAVVLMLGAVVGVLRDRSGAQPAPPPKLSMLAGGHDTRPALLERSGKIM